MSYYKTHDSALFSNTIEHIQREYLRNNLPWSLAFSGGKDSSALLKLVYLALEELPEKTKPVTIVYCDTGVEIPIIRSSVIKTLYDLSREAVENDMPLRTQIVRPALQDRYFSKVIGRGYPPPTFKFRWCTDVLRIKPIRSVINNTNEQSVILLGTRKGESIERDRVLSRYKTSREYYFQQANSRNVVIYSPLIEYQASDIWSILRNNSMPQSIDTEKLQILYSIVNSGHANNLSATDILNAKGRFGCWTCTVIRHDRAVENLIRGGEESLVPLFEFRNWLVLIRDNPSYRLKTRRNGNRGPGPFTIEAREEILDRLLEAQSRARFDLISIEETEFIRNQWLLDS
jgi:DNA sulfur modification protein DndC